MESSVAPSAHWMDWQLGLAAPLQRMCLTQGIATHCQKGFYALNVQAVGDMKKRFLWSYPSNKGSTQDSTAFSGSRLCELLKELSGELSRRGLFIAGDSAYPISPFIITPYKVLEMGNDPCQHKDSFNFHLSSCRIAQSVPLENW